MSLIVGPLADVAAVGVIAGRVRRFAEAIQQAHHFGLGPGDATEPWTYEFQAQAVNVYAEVLPWPYLTGLASGFEDGATLMVSLSAPPSIAVHWTRLQAYLRAASRAINTNAPDPQPSDLRAVDVESDTPPVMPFDRLAKMINTDGAAALQLIGATIEQCCGQRNESPLTDQEVAWMRRLINGDRIADIAEQSGYSERTFYRALTALWGRLEVKNKSEAIALVVKQGWIRTD